MPTFSIFFFNLFIFLIFFLGKNPTKNYLFANNKVWCLSVFILKPLIMILL